MSDLASIIAALAAERKTIADRVTARMEALARHLEAYTRPRWTDWPQTLRTYANGILANDPAVIVGFVARNRSSQGITDIGLFHDALAPGVTAAQHKAATDALDRLVGVIIPDAVRLENFVFNVRDPAGQILCPCCGDIGSFHGVSFGARGGIIGTGICKCCLFEPGFDDDPDASGTTARSTGIAVARYHEAWRADTMPWRGTPDRQPRGWSAQAQLDHLRKTAPYLPGLIEADAWEAVRAREAATRPEQI